MLPYRPCTVCLLIFLAGNGLAGQVPEIKLTKYSVISGEILSLNAGT